MKQIPNYIVVLDLYRIELSRLNYQTKISNLRHLAMIWKNWLKLENCQLLGRAYGKDKHDALSNLLKEKPWIKERGFEPCETICKELVSTSNAEAKLSFLTNLLDERQLAEYTNWLKTIE